MRKKNLLCLLLVFYLGNVVPVCVVGISSNVFCIGGNKKYIAQGMDDKARTPFNGGLIPGYTLPKERKLPDPIRALALSGAAQGYYTVLMLNLFRQIPTPLEEAAFMDGAGHVRTLAWRIAGMLGLMAGFS